jgi:serine/threonine protein kinase
LGFFLLWMLENHCQRGLAGVAREWSLRLAFRGLIWLARMKIITESSGSNSRGDEELISSPAGRDSTTSEPPISTVPRSPVSDSERTVISQRPVAAPEEFYRSMPLAELAGLLEGKQLDHFQVEQMIGGGGMGAVFRGRDLRLDRIVAIKVIPASKRDADTLRRFRLEAQSAARLDHPNIARVYYVGEAERWNYIVFEFIDGVNIRDLVDMEGPLSVDDAVFYTRQVAEALQHAHDRNVVHRDIKPSNLLVTAAGAAKVVDMGLARDTSLDKSTADATASGVTLGTFDYISPEQARNPRDADVRSDLYSLGCTLFFMLTGNPPFPEGTALQKLLNHGSQPPPDPRAWREDLSDELYEILMKLMAKRPSDRYQRPVELINDLLLLAEAENLPRSRSPGTLLMNPSVAQRSLLETNLPWMVAAAFLFGSTLWMQSVQSLSSTFAIPPANFGAAGEPATAGAAQQLQPPAPATEQLPLKPFSDVSRELTINGANQVGIGKPLSQSESTALAPPSFPGDASLLPNGADSKTAPTAVRAEAPLPTKPNPASPGSNDLPTNPAPRSAAEPLNAGPPQEFTGEAIPAANAAANAAGNELEGLASPKSISTLVVSDRLPAGIDRQAWVGSLASALRRAEIETDIRTIEIVGRVSIDSSVRIGRADLMIRSGIIPGSIPGSLSNRATIEFAPSLLARLQPGESLIEIASQSLQCLDLNFDVSIGGDAATRGVSVFGIGPGGKLDLDGCRITVKGTPLAASAAVITISDDERRGSNSIAAPIRVEDRPKVDPLEPSSIVLKNSVMRGDASLFRVTASHRIEIEMKQMLVGLVGWAVDIAGVDGDDRMPPVLRMYCQDTTFATAEGFARILYRQDAGPSLAINRNSKNCVYWALPDKPHFLIEGVQRSEDLDDLMHLQGGENAYDANIGLLCKCLTREKAEVPLQFSSAQAPWFQEFGNEWSVSWQSPVPRLDTLYQLDAVDLGLRAGMFMPGYEPSLLAPTLVD